MVNCVLETPPCAVVAETPEPLSGMPVIVRVLPPASCPVRISCGRKGRGRRRRKKKAGFLDFKRRNYRGRELMVCLQVPRR
jgi:hypothetical protein